MTTVDPHVVALLGLPAMGPRRVANLLAAHETPEAAWSAVAGGTVDRNRVRLGGSHAKHDDVLADWRSAASGTDIEAVLARHAESGVDITGPDDPEWPYAFAVDPEPPLVIFTRGDRSLLDRLAVAIVGTRRCTAGGASVARALGHDLARSGVGVVSGLALGIDGAAHRGSLDAGGPTIGVVATGLDIVYPRRHADLWEAVATDGVLVSEAPLGTRGERWRFPARNRLIAALASAVVVVESNLTGGSMLTVESAIERQTDVLAVPGPVRAPASAGPNQLLVDGCGLVRDATDVLVALGSAGHGVAPAVPEQLTVDAGGAGEDAVARAVSWSPSSLEEIVAITGLSLPVVAGRLAELEVAGMVERSSSGGFQRCGSR